MVYYYVSDITWSQRNIDCGPLSLRQTVFVHDMPVILLDQFVKNHTLVEYMWPLTESKYLYHSNDYILLTEIS